MGHPVAAKPDRACSRSGQAGTLYNLQPAEALYFNQQQGMWRGREGVQSSSNSNHRHPNLFRGKRAPQLVISTTSNSNQRKILFYVI